MRKITDNLGIVFKNPLLICRIIKNYCRVAFGKHALAAVELAVTYECNLACGHCSAVSLCQKDKTYLSLQEIKAITVQLTKAGAYVINLTGGEPLLRKDVFDIVSFIKNSNTVATILTNGYLLTREFARELRRLSLDAIQISLNSPKKGFFEQGETGPSLDGALSGIENAKSSGLRVNISTVVTNEIINNGQIEEMIRFCKEIRAVLNLIIPCAVGRWSKDSGKLLSDNSWKIFQELCRKKGVRTDTHMNYFGTLCPAGRERIYVSAYGDVLPCDFIHISFGNLKSELLPDVLERMKTFAPIKNRRTACLAGRDPDFIERYLNYIQDKNLPYSYRDLYSNNDENVNSDACRLAGEY